MCLLKRVFQCANTRRRDCAQEWSALLLLLLLLLLLVFALVRDPKLSRALDLGRGRG